MGRPDDDYKATYESFWKDLVENEDGTLNRDQVMRELHDYHAILESVPKVYYHITDGQISKPNTTAEVVMSVANDCIEKHIRDAFADRDRSTENG